MSASRFTGQARRRRWRIAAPLALACALGLAPALAKAPPRPELLPLSEADMNRGSETGCTFSFGPGNATLVQAIGSEVMVRTPERFNLCRMDEAQVTAFTDGKGVVSCGGRQLRLRRTGPLRSHPASDSASWRATLTILHGRSSQTIRGLGGVAC